MESGIIVKWPLSISSIIVIEIMSVSPFVTIDICWKPDLNQCNTFEWHHFRTPLQLSSNGKSVPLTDRLRRRYCTQVKYASKGRQKPNPLGGTVWQSRGVYKRQLMSVSCVTQTTASRISLHHHASASAATHISPCWHTRLCTNESAAVCHDRLPSAAASLHRCLGPTTTNRLGQCRKRFRNMLI